MPTFYLKNSMHIEEKPGFFYPSRFKVGASWEKATATMVLLFAITFQRTQVLQESA